MQTVEIPQGGGLHGDFRKYGGKDGILSRNCVQSFNVGVGSGAVQ